MFLAKYSFVTYDNPLTLANICSVFIVRNIEHFVTEAVISDKTFYLWKEGLSFSDATLEQLFQTAINNRGELDARWITLFLGSRCRARQLITALFPVSENEPDGVYSQHDESVLSSVTSAEGYLPVPVERNKQCTSSPSNSPVFVRAMSAAIRYIMTNLQRAFRKTAVTSGTARQTTIDSTGVLRRVLIQHNVSIPEPALLSSLLVCSKPLEITLEDCSNLDSRLRVLELIAAHCPHLITLKLYRCGTLLTQCFERFAAASLSLRSMKQFASRLDLSHLRFLALSDLPAAAFASNSCLLLEQLSDRLSTHLLQLDLSDADLSTCASFEWLSCLRHLRALILTDCQMPTDRAPLIDAICSLSDLIRLDIAHFGGHYLNNNPEYDGPIRVCFGNEVLVCGIQKSIKVISIHDTRGFVYRVFDYTKS